jgi:hypothetical protein
MIYQNFFANLTATSVVLFGGLKYTERKIKKQRNKRRLDAHKTKSTMALLACQIFYKPTPSVAEFL